MARLAKQGGAWRIRAVHIRTSRDNAFGCARVRRARLRRLTSDCTRQRPRHWTPTEVAAAGEPQTDRLEPPASDDAASPGSSRTWAEFESVLLTVVLI